MRIEYKILNGKPKIKFLDLGVYGMMILKWISENCAEGCGLDSYDSGGCPVTGFVKTVTNFWVL
jgi:hypothetical protein